MYLSQAKSKSSQDNDVYGQARESVYRTATQHISLCRTTFLEARPLEILTAALHTDQVLEH